MNSLEFVESRIKFFEEKIKEEEQEFKIMKTEDKHIINYYKNHIDILKEKKKIFEQIKVELEAWEVVKNKVKFEKIRNHDFYFIGIDSQANDLISEEEYETIKKALEVENEKKHNN